MQEGLIDIRDLLHKLKYMILCQNLLINYATFYLNTPYNQ